MWVNQKYYARLAQSPKFQTFILGIIILASLLLGLETNPDFWDRWQGVLSVVEAVILWIFIGEIWIRMAAEGKRFWRFFYSAWNVFDFLIVLVMVLPINGHYFAVLRLLRLLRVFRLFTALPRLRGILTALANSLPSMGYVIGILSIFFYVYGVAGTFLFGANDPMHFGTLPLALLSLFQVVTLEGWAELMYIQMYGCDRYGYESLAELCTQPQTMPILGALFFVSFVLIGSMIVINLFVGILTGNMMNSIDDLRHEEKAVLDQLVTHQQKTEVEIEQEIVDIQNQLRAIQVTLERLGDRMGYILSRMPDR